MHEPIKLHVKMHGNHTRRVHMQRIYFLLRRRQPGKSMHGSFLTPVDVQTALLGPWRPWRVASTVTFLAARQDHQLHVPHSRNLTAQVPPHVTVRPSKVGISRSDLPRLSGVKTTPRPSRCQGGTEWR